MTYCRTLALAIIALVTISISVLAQKTPRPVDIASANPRSVDVQKPGVLPAREKKSLAAEDASAELITATTYAYTSQAGVALEDMSSGTTTLIGASTDDNNSVIANIGFEYWFDGVRFTQFGVNGNGFLKLGSVSTGTSFTNGIGTTANAPKIMPYWDDLCVGSNGKVHFKTVGSSPNRKLVVEFQNMQITRGAGCAGAGTGTFQLWLFESTSGGASPGVVEFVYGALPVPNTGVDGGYSVGLQSGAATNFASVTTSSNSVSYAAANNANGTAIAAGTAYLFTPNIPAAPSNNLVTGITPTSLTLNWLDNSSNEAGFVIYRSTDNVVFTFLAQTAANATSFTDTGLTPSTNYFYTVQAVSEGALSTLTSFSGTTAAPGNISCAGAGGNWSVAGTWSGGVPTAGDNVTVGSGCTVTVDTAALGLNLTVQNGGVVQFETTTARTLTLGGSATIDSGGTVQSAATGTVTTHILSVGGNVTNNGTLDLSTNGNTAAARLTFTGAANSTFSGTGATTDIRTITVNKGTSSASVVDVSPTNFTVQGVTTDVAGFLTLTNGTFKISGTFTMTNRVFPGPTYTIPATAGIWLNNPNFTVAGTASGTTSGNNGLFRLTQGIYTIGLTAGDGFGASTTTAVYIIEGGTLNANGRFDPQGTVNYTQTGGTINVAIVGNNVSAFGSFEIFGTASSFTMSGGTINVINPSTGTTKDDFSMTGTTTNITGGQIIFGATGAPPASTYAIPFGSTMPNFTVNPTMTLNVNNVRIFFRGTTVTNNGAITSTGTSALFDFANAAGAMTYNAAGTFGTLAAPFQAISSNSPGFTTLNAPIVTLRVNLFTAGFINSNQITLGNGGTSASVVQTGSAGLLVPGGTFDVSPVHNAGTGGHIVLYAQESVMRTTGFEINPSRTLNTLIVLTTNNVTISGGNITVTAALTLTDGVVFTGNNTLIFNGVPGSATRTNGYIDGNMGRDFTAIGSFTFFVGQNGFTPVVANVTANTLSAREGGTEGSTPRLTVRSFDSRLAGFAAGQSISRNWSIEETGNITADLSFTYLLADVNGIESDYRVYRREAGGVTTNLCPGSPCVNTGTHTVSVTGVTQFSRWTAAELLTPTAATANISGRVLTSTGMPIANVKVVLSGGELASPVIVYTGHLGFYNFVDLPVGQNYVVTVKSRRFFFTDPSHLIDLQDGVTDADFIADPDSFKLRPGK